MSSRSSEPQPSRRPGLAHDLIRPAFRLDRTQIKPMLGVEGALGIAVPLALGLLVDHTQAGAWAAIGAFLTNFSLFQPGYRVRVRVVVVASIVVATAIFLGALVGIQDPAVFALVAVWTFGAGMLVALGPNAAMIGVVSSVGMLVATAGSTPPLVAFEHGAAALGGGACVALLALVFRRRSQRPESMALADAYQALAAYAAALPGGASQLPDAAPFDSLATTLGTPGPHRFRALGVRDAYLAKQAEVLRTTLGALAMTRDRAGHAPADANADVVRFIDQCAGATADACGAMAEACKNERPLAEIGIARQLLAARGCMVRTGHRFVEKTADTLYREILGALRAAHRALRGQVPEPTVAMPTHVNAVATVLHHSPSALGEAWLAIRANLTLGSTACRHALRLAATVTVATALYRVIDTHDGFWIVVAVIFIMKPDFGATVGRSLLRIIGTLTGATLATLLLASLQPGPIVLSVVIVVTSACAYALFSANYGAFTIFLTCLTVCLAALLGLPPMTAVANRAVDNVIGGCLTILAVVVWPSWVATEVPHLVATCVRAEHRFCDAVLSLYTGRQSTTAEGLAVEGLAPAETLPVAPPASPAASPAPPAASPASSALPAPPQKDLPQTAVAGADPADADAVDACMRAARLARSNAEAALERMAAETPGLRKGTLPLDTAAAVLAQMHRLGLAGLWLRALTDQGVQPAADGLAREQRWLAVAATAVAQAMESGAPRSGAGATPPPWDLEPTAVAGIVNVMLDAVAATASLYDERLSPRAVPEAEPVSQPRWRRSRWRLHPLAVVPAGALTRRVPSLPAAPPRTRRRAQSGY